jgi:hypothetical protein
MSVLSGYINNLGLGSRSVQSHNSVEGLIRSTLGSRFIDGPTEKQIPSNPEPDPILESIHPSIDSTLDNINEVLKEAKKTQIPQQKKKPVPPQQVKKKKPIEKKPLSPFQEALLLESESEFSLEIPNRTQPRSERVEDEHDDYEREPKPKYTEKIIAKPEPRYEEPESLGPIIRRKEYIFHRDSDETFECKVNIEGGSQESNKARLFLKTDVWNLVFDGSIRKDGTCLVPLKKLAVLPEGTTGTAFLEIIVDDVVFIPWESPFRVGTYKRVSVQAPSLTRR